MFECSAHDPSIRLEIASVLNPSLVTCIGAHESHGEAPGGFSGRFYGSTQCESAAIHSDLSTFSCKVERHKGSLTPSPDIFVSDSGSACLSPHLILKDRIGRSV
jgi:hypothetical protein